MTRKETRISIYVWPTVSEPPTDDEFDCGKSLVEPAPVKNLLLRLHQGPPKSAHRHRARNERFRGRGRRVRQASQGKPAMHLSGTSQWDITKDEEIPHPPVRSPSPWKHRASALDTG
jgi:hypothetical protein